MTQISHLFHLDNPPIDIWRVDEPDVNHRESTYPEIQFQPGDVVQIIQAGGCCQTGGAGKTWKRWVNPSGPNSGALYHGLIKVPGMVALARVQDVGSQLMIVPNDYQGDLSLHLGYEDDDYSDNGYWGYDNGTEDQCSGSVNAFIQLLVRHGQAQSPRGDATRSGNTPTVVYEPGSWATCGCS